jgi:ABC-type sugar transport system substrate-binding protein
MLRKTCVLVFLVLFGLTAGVNMLFAGGGQAKPGGPLTPAAQLVPPAGKTLLSLPVDQASPKPIKIAAIIVQSNPWGQAVLAGQEYAKKVLADRNCTVDCISIEDFDAPKTMSVVENCIASGYNAITFVGISDALQPSVDKAVDAGIIVHIFNTDPGPNSKRQAWYGQSGIEGGELCGEALVKAMGGSGKYGIITGYFSIIGHEERRTGAHSVIDKYPDMKLVGEFENRDKAEEAYNIATNLITVNPDLKGIYVAAGGPSGAAKAVEDAGLAGKVAIVCHDVLPESAPYVASGTISAALDQDPFNQGYQPVVDAFNRIVAGIIPPDKTFYKGVMATPQTIRQLFPELF